MTFQSSAGIPHLPESDPTPLDPWRVKIFHTKYDWRCKVPEGRHMWELNLILFDWNIRILLPNFGVSVWNKHSYEQLWMHNYSVYHLG